MNSSPQTPTTTRPNNTAQLARIAGHAPAPQAGASTIPPLARFVCFSTMNKQNMAQCQASLKNYKVPQIAESADINGEILGVLNRCAGDLLFQSNRGIFASIGIET